MKRGMIIYLTIIWASITWAQMPPDTSWIWSVLVIDTTGPDTAFPVNVEEVGTQFSGNTPDIRIHPTTNTTQSEISVAVNPVNPNIVIVSANTTNYPVTLIYGTGWYISTDGGNTWIGSDSPPIGLNLGDPATTIGRNGYIYIGAIAPDSGQEIFRTTDNGQTWSRFTVSEMNGEGLLDKNHIHIDNSETSQFEGRLYAGWTKFGGIFTKQVEISYSSDYGETWSIPYLVSYGLGGVLHQGVNIRTGPQGEVYAVWSVYTDFSNFFERKIGFNRSLNGGESWESPRAIIENIKGIRTSSLGPYGIRANSFPSMAVDLSNGPHRGRIYVVWTNQGRPGINDGDPDIYLIYSDDRGETWSSPVRVNQDSEGNGAYQWFPWIAVDDKTGFIYVIFYDGRNHIGTNKAEVWVAKSTDGGQTFEDFPVSDVAFSVGPIAEFTHYGGDYIGIAAAGGRIYPVWNAKVPGVNHQAWTSPFLEEPILTLIWPDAPNIEVEEADTYAIRYNGVAGTGICEVVAWFSYDGGQTWEDSIRSHPYNPYPTHVENDSILWVVTQHPTEHGRVKIVLYDDAGQTAVDISSYDITVKLARPGNLTASVSSDLESITLTWTDRSNYEEGYEIWRKSPEESSWQRVGIVPQNGVSFVDSTVQPNHLYAYRVRAFSDDSIFSDFSSPVIVNNYSTQIRFATGTPPTGYTNGEKLVHGDGGYYMVYVEDGEVVVRRSVDGIYWGEREVVSEGMRGCEAPAINITENGRLEVVFRLGTDIYYTKESGWVWTKPMEVVKRMPVDSTYGLSMADGGGVTVVAWVDYVKAAGGGDRYKLRVAWSDDGEYWRSETLEDLVDTRGGMHLMPEVAGYDGGVVLVYASGDELRYREFDGEEWSDYGVVMEEVPWEPWTYDLGETDGGVALAVASSEIKYREKDAVGWGEWEIVPTGGEIYTHLNVSGEEEAPQVKVDVEGNLVFVMWNDIDTNDIHRNWFNEFGGSDGYETRLEYATRNIGLWRYNGYVRDWYVRGFEYPSMVITDVGRDECRLTFVSTKIDFSGGYEEANGYSGVFYYSGEVETGDGDASPHELDEEFKGGVIVKGTGGEIEYEMKRAGVVDIEVYDVGGRMVRKLREMKGSGGHRVRLKLRGGVYFARVKLNGEDRRLRFIVVK